MRIGFVGGNGHHLLSSFCRGDHSDFEAAFASDGHDDQRARDRAASWNISQWYDSAAEMMDSFKPDAVNVGAVYGYNSDIIALALERHIPVISDKPVAATWQQYERLVTLTSKTEAPLISEFPFRVAPAFVAAHDAVAQGVIGDVVLATGQKSYRFGDNRPQWYANRTDYGGTILWVASHAIDYVRYVTGKRFTHVSGTKGNVSRTDYGDMEEYTITTLGMEGGGSAVIHADYNRPAKAATHGDDRLRVVGSEGSIEVRDGQCELITHTQPPQIINDRAQVGDPSDEFLAALRGESTDRYNTAHSLEMAAVLLHARDAADNHTYIKL